MGRLTRYAITHGELCPEPPDFDAAARDRRALESEIARCESQLRDHARPLVYSSAERYAEWRDRAVHALRTMRRIRDALDRWCAVNAPSWVRELYEIADDVEDLDERERAAVDEARAFFEQADAAEKRARTA